MNIQSQLDQWKSAAQSRLQTLAEGLREGADAAYKGAPGLLYGALAASSLLPVIGAAHSGDYAPLMALFNLVGGIGGNLLANLVQQAKDQNDHELAAELGAKAATDTDWRATLDTLLATVEAPRVVQAILSEADKDWFLATLRSEVQTLGSSLHVGGDLISTQIGDNAQGQIAIGKEIQQIQAETYIAHQTINHPITQLPNPQSPNPPDPRRAWLQELAHQSNLLPWSAINPNYADPDKGEQRLRLADIYTALETSSVRGVEREEQMHHLFTRLGQAERIPAQEMADRAAQLLVLGNPGSGKSSFVKHLAYTLAQANLAADPAPMLAVLEPWTHGPLLPVLVELRQVAALAAQTAVSQGDRHLFLRYLEQLCATWQQPESWPWLKSLIDADEPGCLILLDGLDEAPTHQRPLIVSMINDLAARYPQHRYLVTSRPYAYIDQPWRLSDFELVTLAPFTAEQIDRFVQNWYSRLAEQGRLSQSDTRERQDQLQNALRQPSLAGLAERPLLLTVMVQLHTYRGRLPHDRTELYADAVDLLLERWESHAGRTAGLVEQLGIPGLKRYNLEAGLYAVAFQAHSQASGESSADIAEADLRHWLALHLTGSWDKAGLFIDYIRERAGLLIRHKTAAYTFIHRTFQEFLAACYLVGQPDYASRAAGLVQQAPDRWREVFLLSVGHAARTHRLDGAISAVRHLCPRSHHAATPAAPEWALAALAGDALVEMGLVGVEGHAVGKHLLTDVRGWLTAALHQDKTLTARQRAQAGRTLAQVGDERPEVMTIDGMEFCYVPAGPFLMGSATEDEQGYDDEKPQHEFDLTYPYWISRYPVTNRQYQFFHAAGGYAEARYWPEAIAQELWHEGRVRDVDYTQDDQEKLVRNLAGWRSRPAKLGTPYNLSNHPVVGINWYEALAFSRWLTDYLSDKGWLPADWTFHLPNEPEWEKAARGGSLISQKALVRPVGDGLTADPPSKLKENKRAARRYPWTDKADPNRMNCKESDMSSDNAVGCFPGGVSPYGVEEMSGNAWEWTRSLWGDDPYNVQYAYPYQAADGRENLSAPVTTLRITRGGSYRTQGPVGRCASRGRNVPDRWHVYFGLRVVASPFTSGR